MAVAAAVVVPLQMDVSAWKDDDDDGHGRTLASAFVVVPGPIASG